MLIPIAGCSKTESIQIAGSTTVLPVVSKAAEQLHILNPELRIIVSAGGSGVGINQLGEGRLDIGMISRDITLSETARHSEVEFFSYTIGLDAVVPVISSEIFEAGITALSIKQIADIYSGKIRNWQSLGGPDREILVVDKEKSRGTRHVFMAVIMGDSEADAPGADLVLGSNNEEQTAIVQSDAAIGMLSHAWLNNDVRGVAIKLDNGTIVEPTLENITSGDFPITRALLLVTNGEAQGNSKIFIDFLLGDAGQDIVEDAGYVRIR